jgi:hypothetical protein
LQESQELTSVEHGGDAGRIGAIHHGGAWL